VARRSGGNPLFAIELARSGGATSSGALSSILAERLSSLDGPARELVSWAAAIGHAFDVEIVGRATGMPSGEMLAALDKLERAAIIRPAGERLFDFTHDLVRDAAYQMTSGPRRALVHHHIARALSESHDGNGALAGDIVHHASLAGDHELAANAAVEAGKHCLRFFAYSEAVNVARRGLQIVEAIAGDKRIELEMRLLNVIVMSRAPVRERLAYAGRIAEVSELARRAGLARTAGLGAHLIAFLHYETNHFGEAAESSLRSAEISRMADPRTAAISMATTARCLLSLQRDVSRAEDLLAQAQAIGVPHHELSLGVGLLHAHHGRVVEATHHLQAAFEAASRNGDHWREWTALSRLVTLALEEDDPALALKLCASLKPVADKMVGGSEGVRTAVLERLARFAAGQDADVDDAIQLLREIDSKSDLAWALNFIAAIELHRGHKAQARAHAREALDAAESVGRQSEIVIARSILGQPVRPSPDITARARRFLKERKHGHPRSGTELRDARHL
jgi:tetratricopeptide (TPR) repeat protein